MTDNLHFCDYQNAPFFPLGLAPGQGKFLQHRRRSLSSEESGIAF
jgi:hypothetical protein